MDDNGSVGFNKRRAEGRDKDDKPKTLQLKARKLNPANTIAYVQVYSGVGLTWKVFFFNVTELEGLWN